MLRSFNSPQCELWLTSPISPVNNLSGRSYNACHHGWYRKWQSCEWPENETEWD